MATTYQLPVALGGGILSGVPGIDGLIEFDVPAVGRVSVPVTALVPVVPPEPADLTIVVILDDATWNVFHRDDRHSAASGRTPGFVWWSHDGHIWMSWAEVCETGVPVAFVRRAGKPRGICPGCSAERSLDNSGRVAGHDNPNNRYERCKGAHLPPSRVVA